MTCSFGRVAFTGTALGLILAANPAWAQDAGTGADNDIVVTARRVEEKLQDVPISITVVTQEAVSNRNMVNTADLATYTPSLSSNSRFGPEKSSFAIRGFVQDEFTAPSVGVYFADVVGLRSFDQTTAGDGVGVGAMFDLQNVQVLKGPQGTLFGRNTTGGAILIVPKKPTDNLEGYVEGSAGDYDMWRAQGVINIPLADTFKVRLGVDRQKRDGYLINHSGIGPKDFADTNYTSARLSIVANLTPDLENYTIATYSDSHTHGFVQRIVKCNPAGTAGAAIGAFYGCAQIARQNARGDGFWDIENSDPASGIKMRQWQIINTTTWTASDTLTVKNIVSYGEFRSVARMPLWGDNFINPLTPGATFPDVQLVLLGNNTNYDQSSQNTITEELQFQGRSGDGKLTWQAGGYMEISNPLGYSSQFVPSVLRCTDQYALKCSGQGYISVPFIKNFYRGKALYAQATYNFTDKLALTAGARYTWDKISQYLAGTGINFLPPNNTPFYFCNNVARTRNPDGSIPVVIKSPNDFKPCGLTFTEQSKKPTWMIDLEYKPNSDMMVYAKWSRGYRAGGVENINPYFETWEPETVDTYEVGGKASFRGAVSGYLNVAAFYNDFRNQQVQTSLISADPLHFVGGGTLLNVGKSRIWGVEVDASVSPFRGLRLDVGYAYLNTQVQSLTVPPIPAGAASLIAAIVPSASVGDPLALSPKNRVTATGTYTLPLDESIGKISFSATYTYTDRQVASKGTDPSLQVLPASNLINLNANWENVLGQPIDLGFFMTNVANKAFPLNVGNSWYAFGAEFYTPNQPRMWGARLKYRFGS